MKMEPSFRDLKGLLGLEKVMSKKLENLEKWIAFMLLAYAVGLLIGETIRDEVYRGKKAPGLLGAFYPPPAPAPAEAQAIFEAHPAGPGPVQGHRPRPCPISCLKVSSLRIARRWTFEYIIFLAIGICLGVSRVAPAVGGRRSFAFGRRSPFAFWKGWPRGTRAISAAGALRGSSSKSARLKAYIVRYNRNQRRISR
jgi:hypothetical protein